MIYRKIGFKVLGVTIAALSAILGDNLTAFSQTVSSTDSATIVRRYNSLQEALLAHDTISIGDFYSIDAVSLLQDQPIRQGRESIAARWAKVLRNPFIFSIISPTFNFSPSGRDAFQFGKFEIHSADTTNTLLASGNVMFVWRKQVDLWRIVLEMDNFNRSPNSTRK